MTFVASIHKALADSLAEDRNVIVCGNMVKFGIYGGWTEGLIDQYPEQVINYPISESLMNSSALGLALAGKRVVMVHGRMEFAIVGMDALVNHIPQMYRKLGKLPIVLLVQIGRRNGDGAQHNKDLTSFFTNFEGWKVIKPQSPEHAYSELKGAIFGDRPVLFVVHRELFNEEGVHYQHWPKRITLRGASQRD